jgi:PAT family beta-lactamase induction signal transducer AmpG
MYVPMLLVTRWAPEPEAQVRAPQSWREAIWDPFFGFLSKPRAIEILAFVFLYKIADNLAQALTRPFLIDMGYNADQRGIALATVTAFATVGGAVVGGWITTLIGLGHSLWLFGLLQITSNVGYFLIAGLASPVPMAMYAAAAFELGTSGLGTGAFTVLLIRITQKRFSATQYALFSSLFAVPRIISGPIAGATVETLGWQVFYVSTMVIGIPGLIMLGRFVPIGTREPQVDDPGDLRPERPPRSTGQLVIRGVAGGLAIGAATLAIAAFLAALEGIRTPEWRFDYVAALWRTVFPTGIGGWLQLVGILSFAVVGGLFVAAWSAARGRPRT